MNRTIAERSRIATNNQRMFQRDLFLEEQKKEFKIPFRSIRGNWVSRRNCRNRFKSNICTNC